MGYSGYQEIICEFGHYSTHSDNTYDDDSFENDPRRAPCKTCGGNPRFRHTVDQTNGYNEMYEYSCDAPKDELPFEDKWCEDHYGNKYAIKVKRYSPPSFNSVWKEIKVTA